MDVARQIARAALVAVIAVSHGQPAKAQTIGASCSFAAGTTALIRSSSTGELLICDGSTWVLAEAVTTGGYIGIGTTSPAYALDVTGTGHTTGTFTIDALSGSNNAVISLTGRNSGTANAASINANYLGGLVMTPNASDPTVTIGTSSPVNGNTLSVYGTVAIGTTYVATAAPINGLIVQGNVGIGTTSPNSTFTVIGANSDPSLTHGTTSAATLGGVGSYVISMGQNASGPPWYYYMQVKHAVADNSGLLALNPLGGNVGIGTATPGATLHVNGPLWAGTTTVNTGPSYGFRAATGGNTVSEATSFAQGSYIAMYSNPQGISEASANGYSITYPASSSGIFGATALTFGVNGTEEMRILSSGNVGIGSTSPVSALDISQKTDALALPVGTAGQRPSGTNGMVRYNSTVPQLEGYINGAWAGLATSGVSTITLGTSASVTNPQRSGDATTGLFSPAVSTVAVATGGTERVRIDGTGNVGIGTMAPTVPLQVQGIAGFTDSSASLGGVTIYPNRNNANEIFSDYYGTGSVRALSLGVYGVNEQMLNLSTNGNVGIGTTVPATALEVVNSGFRVRVDPSNGITSFDNSGNVITSLGVSGSNDGVLKLAVGGSYKVFLDANGLSYFNGGNVGIGTTAPTAALDVRGVLAVGGSPGSVGGAGDLIVNRNDGNGAIYFGNSAALHYIFFNAGVGFNLTDPLIVGSGTADNRTYSNPNNPYAFGASNGSGNGHFYYGASAAANPDAIFSNQSGTERMRITDGGNVGIGTTSPAYNLDVDGEVRLGLGVAPSAPSGTSILGSASAVIGGYAGNYLTIGQYPSTFAQWIQSSYQVPNTAVYSLLLQPLGGNIGIGTTSPQTKADVVDSSKTSTVRAANEILRISSNGSGADSTLQLTDGVANNYLISGTQGNLYFAAGGVTPSVQMAILAGGNVGIGSTSPVSSLDISQRTDALALPAGTTGQRPTGTNGMVRYNSTLAALEGYINGAWAKLATTALQSSLDFPIGGFNNFGQGLYPAWDVTNAGSGVNTGPELQTLSNSGSPYIVKYFRWPNNWDNTQSINAVISISDSSGSCAGGGAYRFSVSVSCGGTSGTALVTTWYPPAYGTTVYDLALSAIDVSTPSCSPNQLSALTVSRDTSVSGNCTSGSGLAIHDLAVLYSTK